jgi:hypothetical protein
MSFYFFLIEFAVFPLQLLPQMQAGFEWKIHLFTQIIY